MCLGTKALNFLKKPLSQLDKAILEKIKKDGLGHRYVSLDIDQIEALIKNPYIISREEFEKIKNEKEGSLPVWFFDGIYKNFKERNMPKDFKDKHFRLLNERLQSLLEESSLKIEVNGTNHGGFPIKA